MLGSGLGFHGNGQPPSAVCFSLDQLMGIGLGILDQRREVGTRLHQTNTEELRVSEPQPAGEYLRENELWQQFLSLCYRDPRGPPIYCRMDLNTSTAYSCIQMAMAPIIFAVNPLKH